MNIVPPFLAARTTRGAYRAGLLGDCCGSDLPLLRDTRISPGEQRRLTESGVGRKRPRRTRCLLRHVSVGRRRHIVLRRLCQLRDSEQFPSLPDDLQQRIREIVSAAN
jgi:hypothetical protein